ADELVFFGLTDIATWIAKTCPLAEVLTQAAQVEKFQTTLLRYRELRQEPTASAAEDRRRRKTLDEQLSQPVRPQAADEEPKGSKEGGWVDLLLPPSSHTTPLTSSPAGLLTSMESRQPTVEVSLGESVQSIAEQVPVPTVVNGAGSTAVAEEPPAASLVSVVLL